MIVPHFLVRSCLRLWAQALLLALPWAAIAQDATPLTPHPLSSLASPTSSAVPAALLRRLVLGPLTPLAPGAPETGQASTAGAGNDVDAQGHLAQALAATGAFSLHLRADIDSRPSASGLAAFREALAGADALVAGTVSVTPAISGAIVRARLALRSIDPYTGQPLFTLAAAGEGASADEALGLAARQAARGLLAQLAETPWQAYVLAVDGERVRLSAGEAQGLRPGQWLEVQTQGDRVRSRRTGLLVALPGRSVARLQVDGDGTARRISGSLTGLDLRELVVRLLPSAAASGAADPLSSQPPRKSP